VVNPEKLTLVAAGAIKEKFPEVVSRLLMLNEERTVSVPARLATEVNDEKLRLVAAAPFNVNEDAAVIESKDQDVNAVKLKEIPTPLPPVKEGILTDVAFAQFKFIVDVTVVKLGNDKEVNEAHAILKLAPALTNEDRFNDVNPDNVNCNPIETVTKFDRDRDVNPLDDRANCPEVEDKELKSTLVNEFAVKEKNDNDVTNGI